MKILKIAGGVLAALVVLALVVGMMMPSGWKVERSIVVAAQPEQLVPLIATPKRWNSWAAWNNEADPEATWLYFGGETGPGAKMAWRGPKMGQGLLEITSATTSQVTYQMEMEGELTLDGENTKMEGGSPAKGTFALTAEGEGTRVTWTDAGDMGANPLMRLFVPMLEKMLGAHFEQGLANLQREGQKAQAVADQKARELEGALRANAAAEAAMKGALEAAGMPAAPAPVAAPAAP